VLLLVVVLTGAGADDPVVRNVHVGATIVSGSYFTITASIDAVFTSQDLHTPGALLQAADAAMHEAEALGRARVRTRVDAGDRPPLSPAR